MICAGDRAGDDYAADHAGDGYADDRAGDDYAADLGALPPAGDALSTGARSASRVSRSRWRTIASIIMIVLALALLQATALLLIRGALVDESVPSGSDPRGTVYDAPLLNERFTGGARAASLLS